MRLQAKTVLTGAVLVATAVVLGAAGSVRWLRVAAEQDEDALAESIAAQELFAAEIASAAPAAETARVVMHLGAEPRVTETLETLHGLAEAAQVVLIACGPSKTSERGRIEFAVSGHAPGRALCAFLAGVEQNERLFAISAARFRPASPGRIGFELTVAAFHEEASR